MHKEIQTNQLTADIRQLIEESRQQVAAVVNTAMSVLYWRIGQKINDEILQNKRADYGKQVVGMLSRQLTEEFGPGWNPQGKRTSNQNLAARYSTHLV